MPTTRRSAGRQSSGSTRSKPKSSVNQTKLAFHGSGISKHTTPSTPTKKAVGKKLEPEEEPEVHDVDVEDEDEDDADADATLVDLTAEAPATEAEEKKTVAAPAVKELDLDEQAALKIKDAQIKKYWGIKEAARKVPRVHQKDLELHEQILREWDVNAEFGPCIGITRTERWKRANNLGLEPPIEILAVLMREKEDGNNPEFEMAHVDRLMNLSV